MPAIQTSYGTIHSAAVAGMIADMRHSRIRSVLASAPIQFGAVVVQGTADNQGNPATTGTTPYMGIAALDITVPPADNDAYGTGDTMAVITSGPIWVVTTATTTAGSPVYYVPATGAITPTATNNTAIPGAVFETSGAASALVLVRL